MWKQSSWQIIINEIHRFPMNVKLHSSFILKVSHLFISSLISEKNNIWCRRFWILSRVSQKMELPLLEHSLGKFHNDDIVLSKNCFLQYSKNVPKIYWYIDFDKMFCTCSLLKRCSLFITLWHVWKIDKWVITSHSLSSWRPFALGLLLHFLSTSY